MKYVLDYDIDNLNQKSFSDFCSDSVSSKTQILKYMRSFKPKLFTSAPVIDILTNTDVDVTDNGYTDNVYTWYESEIYHFEKYNLKLNDDFIAHVLSKTSE